MSSTQYYDLSLVPESSIVRVHASQWDNGERKFIFTLYDENGLYTVPSGAVIELRATKADNHGYAVSTEESPTIINYSGNQVTVVTERQMCAAAGEQDFKINIVSGAKLIASARYTLVVDEDTLNDTTDISDSEIPAIIELAEEQLRQATMQAQLSKSYAQGHSESGRTGENTDNAKYYKEQAQTIAGNVQNYTETAEAYAVGKRNGTDVPSTDPTYHNNAKYYAGMAATSEQNAANSATAASGSVEDAEAWAKGTKNGTSVESTDPTYHNNAKYYSEQADEIGEYWDEQTKEDGEAWTKGTRNGTAVEDGDPTYHNNAKYWSEQSRDSATASETSRQAARLSEQNAKASEDILQYYADFVIPHFIIANNRLYISDTAQGEFIVANNRLYIKNAS